MEQTVLIVEDDPHASEIINLYLKNEGFAVLAAYDGVDGLRKARESKPAVIVLDLMLPKLNGIELCKTIRKESNVPIVMLTAMVEEEDRLAGLNLGADDYITKPFSPKELVARIKAVLRRTVRDNSANEPQELTFRDIALSYVQRSVRVGKELVPLTPTEFRILALLMREPSRVFSRDHIIDQVFGYDFGGFDRSVDTHVSNLRRKLESSGAKSGLIKSVYGVGYKLNND